MSTQLLCEALVGMQVPPTRASRLNIEDLLWLRRNLAIRNFDDPKLQSALELVTKCIHDHKEDEHD